MRESRRRKSKERGNGVMRCVIEGVEEGGIGVCQVEWMRTVYSLMKENERVGRMEREQRKRDDD